MLETTIKDIEVITMTMFNKKLKSQNTKSNGWVSNPLSSAEMKLNESEDLTVETVQSEAW